ncbi:MAG: GAF domain-containing protein [Pseudomonadota bacterium]|nr:GAF domain-containing protein [Pseudomonadota bacterium]
MNEAGARVDVESLQLSAEHCMALCHALPRAGDLESAMRLVESVRHSLLGPGLLTVNVDVTGTGIGIGTGSGKSGESDAPGSVALERVWSSNPAAYPVAGRKRKRLTPWTQQLLRRAEIFIGEGEAALAQVFDDHAVIAGLGLRSVVNVPLLDDTGRCFATFNALGPRSHWLLREVLALQLLAALATPAVRRATSSVLQVMSPLPCGPSTNT